MVHVAIFDILLIGCCSYALWRGGAPERWAAGLEILAVLLTALIQMQSRAHHYFDDFSPGIFLVDAGFLAALCVIALTADRFWAIAAAGFQVADIVVHLCKVLAPDILPLGYGVGISAWGYPKLVMFAIGARRHRLRLERYGRDPSWSRPASLRGALQAA